MFIICLLEWYCFKNCLEKQILFITDENDQLQQSSFLNLTLEWYVSEMTSSNLSSSAPLIVMDTVIDSMLSRGPYNENCSNFEAVKRACLQTQVNVIKGQHVHFC